MLDALLQVALCSRTCLGFQATLRRQLRELHVGERGAQTLVFLLHLISVVLTNVSLRLLLFVFVPSFPSLRTYESLNFVYALSYKDTKKQFFE